MKKLFGFCFLLISYYAHSQEVLSPLTYNPRLVYSTGKAQNPYGANARGRHKVLVQDGNLLEETDTLNIPFVDEFSTNSLKPYNYAGYIYDSIFNAFGPCDTIMKVTVILDSFSMVPTFTYYFDTAHQRLDSTANPATKYYYYPGLSGDCFYHLGDSITVYPLRYVLTFDSTTGRIITSTLDTNSIDTIFTYSPVLYKSKLPLGTKWADNYAYQNYTTAYLPPTIGVATLDGLNQYGQPYNNSAPTNFGIADYLTSKPINLGTVPGSDTTTYLSFFYQRGGFGDVPTLGDSLCVQFLNNYTNQWDPVWSVTGDSVIPQSPDGFIQAMIRIPVDNLPYNQYFFNGFQFRFLNYGSLTGNNDVWNIDYVRLDKNRSINDTAIADIAFQYPFPSILKRYEQMPAWQFRDSIDMADSISLAVSNLNPAQIGNPPSTVFGIDANQTYPTTNGLYTTNYNFNANPENFILLRPATQYTAPSTGGTDSMVVNSEASLGVNNVLATNDTIRGNQVFGDVLAYDDGTAELAYGLQNLDLKKFGYEFLLNQPDTLVGFQVMFSNITVNVHDLVFAFNLWDTIKLNDPFYNDSAIWVSNNSTPFYIDSVNGFASYRIDPLPLPKLKYYFGWAQTDTRNLQIGYDLNSVKGRSHMYIYTSGVWHGSTIGTPGSPMIRLLLKHSYQTASGIKDISAQAIKVYPNPTSGFLSFELPKAENSYFVEMYNMLGQLSYSTRMSGDKNSIDIHALEEGIYMLRLTDSKTGISYQNKISKTN